MGKTGAIEKNPRAKAKRDQKLVALRMEGHTLASIEKKLGYSKGHLSHLLNHDEDVKALIEQASRCQVSILPKAIERHVDILTDTSASNSDALKAISLVYNNTGVAPTNTTSQTINNIMYQQNNLFDAKVLTGFQRWFLGEAGHDAGSAAAEADDVIDAESVTKDG